MTYALVALERQDGGATKARLDVVKCRGWDTDSSRAGGDVRGSQGEQARDGEGIGIRLGPQFFRAKLKSRFGYQRCPIIRFALS